MDGGSVSVRRPATPSGPGYGPAMLMRRQVHSASVSVGIC